MRSLFKKKLGMLLCSIMIISQLGTIRAYARPDWPSDTGIQAEAGALMDLDSGAVLFSQNGHVEYPPASITKILTALLVLENASLDETVTYSETAVNSVEADSGNKLSLVAGDTMTVEECLYALLLVSSNQTANALAEHVAGSISGFVDRMNEKLLELGCSESHFENPSGLNGDTQAVSALDMAKIARAAYSNETLLKINSARSFRISSTIQNPDGVTAVNEHRLVITEDASSPYYCPEAKAGKTGYLIKAGNTLVTYGEKDGRRLVSVILKGSPRQYFVDGKELLDFGFSGFQNLEIAKHETRYIGEGETAEIFGTSYEAETLAIVPGQVITLPNHAEFSDSELSIEAPPQDAPEGTVALLSYTYNERKIGSAYLMTKDGLDAYAASGYGAQTEPEEEAETVNGPVETAVEESAQPSETEETESLLQEPDAEKDSAGGFQKILWIGAAAVLVAALAGSACWLSVKRKREEEAEALRRKQRRQRLMEEGAETEAEFIRLLEEKRERSRKKRERP